MAPPPTFIGSVADQREKVWGESVMSKRFMNRGSCWPPFRPSLNGDRDVD